MKSEPVENPNRGQRDRVAQVYFGTLKWGAAGEILRRRIDWMAHQAQGPRILDVGCGEGIIEILLARKGLHVTGVDINAEALAFARDLLAREPENVRARVRFVHGDLAQARLLEDRFDTLVMGELLEHLEDPKLLLDRSLDLIRPDGRVIVTTPFGYHPHEDHWQTFCLSNFMTLVKPRCVVEQLEVEGGYIRMVGRVSGSAGKSRRRLNSKQLLSITETALMSSQQRLHRTISQQEFEEGQAEAAALRKEVEERQAGARALQQRVEEAEAREAGLQKALEQARATANHQQNELNKAREVEAAIRRSIRWQLGTLVVDAVRRPWRVYRLPFDLVSLSSVALARKRAHQSAVPPTLREHAGAAPANAGSRPKPKATTAPSTRSPSLAQTVDWIVDQVEGQHVTVIGCDNGLLIESLARLRFKVTRGDFKSSFAEPLLVQREQMSVSRFETEKTPSAGGYSGSGEGKNSASETGDTAIVWGMSRAGVDAAGFLNCIRDRWARPGAKVIIVEPRFQAFSPDGGEHALTPLLAALRTTTVPVSLSLADDGLRFVGRLGRPGPEVWSQFEAEAWPQLTGEVAKSLRSRQHREIAALEQRVQDVVESTSYKAGQILVRSAQEPRSLWKVPVGLWRLYRSAEARKRSRHVTLPSSSVAPAVSVPALRPPPPRSDGVPVVAAILDTFTEFCLRYEADLVLLSPKHWKQQLDRTQPAFLLVESAWAGNDGAWRYLLTNYKMRDVNPLSELVRHCREQRIPTVFWNKEDPPNFDVFIDVAKDFDFIFTTDEDCIQKYKKVCGHGRIYLMPFASQPRLHNPCRERSWPRYRVCFAGSWMEKYPERKKALQDLLEPALGFGLHIFDRNFKAGGHDPRYRFPDRYQGAIKGSLDYEHMLAAYRCYDVMMNVNTVTDSPTMFSRRVFESLACGTPVISTDSVGLRAMLGNHVRITRGPHDTAAHLQELLTDEERRMREGHLGYRHVHERHTYRHRMEAMFRRVGVRPAMFARRPSVSVIVATCRPEKVKLAISNYAKQTYEEKELLLLLNNAEFDVNSVEEQARELANVRVVEIEGHPSLGACLNRGIEEASGDYIAKMDDDDHYGERYLSDMMLAADFSEAEILGKGTYFVHMEGKDVTALRSVSGQHQFTEFVSGATLTARREVLREIRFPDRTRGEDSNLLAEASKAGCRIYSADAFNILVIRGTDNRRHTWDIDNSEFLKKCRNIRPGLEWDRVMI